METSHWQTLHYSQKYQMFKIFMNKNIFNSFYQDKSFVLQYDVCFCGFILQVNTFSVLVFELYINTLINSEYINEYTSSFKRLGSVKSFNILLIAAHEIFLIFITV